MQEDLHLDLDSFGDDYGNHVGLTDEENDRRLNPSEADYISASSSS